VAAQANVDSLQSALGLDVTKQAPDTFQAAVFAQNRSMSASPYTSAEMLQAYVSAGFSELVPKIVESIDRQAAHRQRLEETCTLCSERREDRAQTGALIVAIIGLLGSLVAAYMGVSAWVCGIGIIVSIGGPNAATVVSRILDK
jgi:hypothetical protein